VITIGSERLWFFIDAITQTSFTRGNAWDRFRIVITNTTWQREKAVGADPSGFEPATAVKAKTTYQNEPTQALLFFSSQSIGSHSSTLFPSGSMIQANLPFSADSGP
jgi:hypothetical protein